MLLRFSLGSENQRKQIDEPDKTPKFEIKDTKNLTSYPKGPSVVS